MLSNIIPKIKCKLIKILIKKMSENGWPPYAKIEPKY